jgi:DNA-binding PadR family transcriptional regulator
LHLDAFRYIVNSRPTDSGSEAMTMHHRAFTFWGPGRPGFGRWQPPFGPWGGPFGPGGPGFGPGFGRHHRGGRARRGNVRAAILALLSERPMHGYEMIQELSNRTGGVWRPSPGSIYPALQLLEDEGLISSQEAEGKRLFSLTEAGRAEAEQGASQTPWDEVTERVDPTNLKLRDTAFQVGAAVMQVATAGSEAQKGKALEVLTEARRRIYSILAEDE